MTVEYPYIGDVSVTRQFREITDTVASARLDAVLRVALRTSREEAARRIESGMVSVNHMPCLSVSHTVHERDILSVRGGGRFVVDTIGPLTKKSRLCLKIRQFV